MDIQTVQLLVKYNDKVNQDMNGLIAKLSPQQWEQDFGAYFGSVKSNCNHIYMADFAWLRRFSKLRQFNYISSPFFSREVTLNTVFFESVSDYLAMRQELDGKLHEFAAEVSTADLEKNLSYINFKGIEFCKNFAGLILHVFNHQTHHRGMISVYLEKIGIENDFSNILTVL